MKKLLFINVFCFVLLSGSADARICNSHSDCAIPSMKSEIANSKAIFSGKVINIEKDGDVKIITFQASRFWKGSVKRITKLYILENMRYGIFYEAGKSYLVFSSQDSKGRLSDRKCSRSKSLEFASDDLKQLGRGKRPK